MYQDETTLFNENVIDDCTPAAMLGREQMLKESGFRDILARFTVVNNGVGLPATMVVTYNGAAFIVPRAGIALVSDDTNAVLHLYQDLIAENSKYRSRLDVSTLTEKGFVVVEL